MRLCGGFTSRVVNPLFIKWGSGAFNTCGDRVRRLLSSVSGLFFLVFEKLNKNSKWYVWTSKIIQTTVVCSVDDLDDPHWRSYLPLLLPLRSPLLSCFASLGLFRKKCFKCPDILTIPIGMFSGIWFQRRFRATCRSSAESVTGTQTGIVCLSPRD